MVKSSTLHLWLGSEFVSRISKVKRNCECKSEKQTLEERLGVSKSMQILICLILCNGFSKMFQKVLVLKFLGKHVWWRPLLSRCITAYSLKPYWRLTPSQIFTLNSNSTFVITMISCLLVCWLVLIHDAHHCQ